MKKCLLIINPRAGKQHIQHELLNIIKIFNENDYMVNVQTTLYHNHAREIAATCNVQELDLIVCTGGDGTLSQVIAGLIEQDVNIPVGYIPCGSTNDYASTLGLSPNNEVATQEIISGQPFPVDVGQFGEKDYFNYVASFGLFTAASYNTSQDFKNLFGGMAYVFNGLADLLEAHNYHVKIKANGENIEGNYILGMISNTTSIAGLIKIDDDKVNLSDGLFEVIFIKKPKDFIDCNKILDGIINFKFDDSVFSFIRANELELFFDEDMKWSLDGEEKSSGKHIKIKNLKNRITILK